MNVIKPMTVTTSALTYSNVPETDYAAWNIATTYALAARRIYVVGDDHWVIESLQASNVGHTPTGLVTDAWWLKVSSTNRYKMFDQSVNSQTVNADSISTTITGDGRVDSIVLLNIDASTAQIIVTDNGDGIVYDKTYSLTSDSGIIDWYAYFFEPIIRLTDKTIVDLPHYSNQSIQVILTNTGYDVKCGVLILGVGKDIGATEYGMSLSINDYSVKQQDSFGNYTILERAYRKKLEATVWVDKSYVDQLQLLLSSYRAIPCVYIGSDEYSSSVIYGFYREFAINITYDNYSICTMYIEGLT